MQGADGTTVVLFVSFAFVGQCLLVAYFLDRLWRRALAERWGWIVYAMAISGVLLAALLIVDGQARRWWLGPLVFAAWGVFGFVVDVALKVPWRSPIRWPLFGPFVALYTAGQVLLWIPLWYVSPALWVVYGLLFTVSTGLNIRGHFVR